VLHDSTYFVSSISYLRLEDDEILESFDVVSLFTNVPTNLAVETAKRRLTKCDEFQEHTNWPVKEVFEGLHICMQASYFTFYSQKNILEIFGTPLGSPVSLILANLFTENIENKAMTDFQHPPDIWKRYVDNTFVVMKVLAAIFQVFEGH